MSVELRVLIEGMNVGDLDNVMVIEGLCFPNPWPRRIFEMEIESHRAFNLIARLDGVLIGYIISWKIYDEVHILNIAVHPEFREHGIGKQLLQECLYYFRENKAKYAILEVRESNLTAQNLYKKFGFNKIGIRKNYYSDNEEDAIVMMLVLDGMKENENPNVSNL